jgi:hypothetical protein
MGDGGSGRSGGVKEGGVGSGEWVDGLGEEGWGVGLG